MAWSAGVLLITAILPQLYVSQSLILIQPRDVPNDFVRDLIAGTAAERLSIITERLLSDTNLTSLLEYVDPKGLTKQALRETPEFAHLNRQQQIAKLRKQIEVQSSSGEQLQRQQSISAFRITGQNQNPLMAQTIVQRLIDVFLIADAEGRRGNVTETAKFLKEALDDLALRLEESDTKLKALRSRRRNELPNQLETNLRRLDNLSNDNQALRNNRTTLVLNQSQLEQQLSDTPKQIPKPTALKKKPTKPPEDPKVTRYREIRKALWDLRTLRGAKDTHPDVIRLQRALQGQEADMTPEQIALGEEDPVPADADETDDEETLENNPRYAEMERARDYLKKQIEYIDQRTAENDAAIATFNLHVNNVPQGEQELADVLRENNDLNRQYQELSSKLAAARLSERAEVREKGGAQFKVIDPASIPLTPTKPSKPKIMVAGFVLSLLIALGLAFLVDVAYQKTWTQSDITHLLGVKVLAEVPRIATRNGAAKAQKKRFGFVTSVGIAGVAYAVFLYFAYAHPGFVLRQLDPLIQKLY
jgi:polysaccharide chain length determinant protein (PEP-CTERM system associated)